MLEPLRQPLGLIPQVLALLLHLGPQRVLGLSLLLRGHGRPLVNGRAKRCDDAVHDEALPFGCSPAADNLDNVAGAEGVVGVVYEVLFWFFKVLVEANNQKVSFVSMEDGVYRSG